MPRISGHTQGIESVRAVVRECRKLGVGHLTLYAFSYENWARPRDEIDALMHLLTEYLKSELRELLDNQIRLFSFGDTSALPDHSQKALAEVCDATREQSGMWLNLALNYSGRQEILRAVSMVASEHASGELDLSTLSEESFSTYLYSSGQPDPDLLIRTSGEMRLSNFLLWQLAYAEIYVTDVLWPDFRETQLHQAISDFQKRTRKFGKVVE